MLHDATFGRNDLLFLAEYVLSNFTLLLLLIGGREDLFPLHLRKNGHVVRLLEIGSAVVLLIIWIENWFAFSFDLFLATFIGLRFLILVCLFIQLIIARVAQIWIE